MAQVRTRIGKGGRLVVPAEHRKALGLMPGDEVILVMQESELRVLTVPKAIQEAQALIRQYIPEGRMLSDEIAEERRREAVVE